MNQAAATEVRRTTPAPPGISTGRKLFFTVVLMLLCVAGLEAAVRVRAWVRYGANVVSITDGFITVDPKLELRVLKPGYELTSKKVAIKINSLGFRGDEFPVHKPPRTVRIAALGASTTFCGEASSNATTWPAQLEASLQAKYPDVRIQVINAGVPGYTMEDTLKHLEHFVLPLEPDVALFYHANNDIAHDTRDLAEKQGIIGRNEGNRGGLSKVLAQYSLLFDLIDKNTKILFARSDRHEGKLEQLPPDLSTHFVAQLGRLDDVLKARHVPLVMSTFLVKYRRDQPRDVQIANADVAFFFMPWMTIDTLLAAMDDYNRAIVDFAHNRGLPIVEERDSIPPDATHFADCMHFADAGCSLMARRFERVLEQDGLLTGLVARARQAH